MLIKRYQLSNKQVDYGKEIDAVMPLYKLTEYSDNY